MANAKSVNLDILRTGAWLTRERVKLVVFGLIAASLIAVVYVVATSDGLNDRFGRPLGTDFSNVYAAGTYVLDGNAAAPFDPPRQYAREQAIFGADTQFYGWHYPPYFLGLAALLAASRPKTTSFTRSRVSQAPVRRMSTACAMAKELATGP